MYVFLRGKRTMKEDFKKFSTAASSAYQQLTLSEREALKQRPSEYSLTLSTAASKREGEKIFRHIQKQVMFFTGFVHLQRTLRSYIQGELVTLGPYICG